MTYSKINFKTSFASSYAPLIVFLCVLFAGDLSAQDNIKLRLSGGISVGYIPSITFGARENSGVVLGVYGDLEYGKIMGRLQLTKPSSSALNDGEAYHGSLGYRFDISEKISLGLLASGGATVIHYNNGINGSNGDDFTNVSPQVGINLVPSYQITNAISVQAGLRYYKGFKAGDRGSATDLMDFSVGLRYSLLK